MFGTAGPPIVPPLPLPDKDEAAPARKYPRPRSEARELCAAQWLAGALFGLAALIVKLLLWRLANPPAFFAALAAFVSGAALWRWLMPQPSLATATRGILVGAAIGLLTPVSAWLMFGLSLLLSELRPIETLGWTFAYAAATFAPVAAVAVPLGGLLGAVLGALEKIQPQRHEDTKP